MIQEKFGNDIALKELAIAINNGIIGGPIAAAAKGFDNRKIGPGMRSKPLLNEVSQLLSYKRSAEGMGEKIHERLFK